MTVFLTFSCQPLDQTELCEIRLSMSKSCPADLTNDVEDLRLIFEKLQPDLAVLVHASDVASSRSPKQLLQRLRMQLQIDEDLFFEPHT